MKKIFFTIIVLTITLSAYFLLTKKDEVNEEVAEDNLPKTLSEKIEQDSYIKDTPILRDVKKLEENLSKSLTEDQLFAPLLDFTVDIKDIPNLKPQARQYSKIIEKSLIEKLNCIEQFCGMEADENDPYFDETDTIAHKMMKRELDILDYLLKEDLKLSKEEQQELINNTLLPLLEVNSPQVIDSLISTLSKLENGQEHLLNAVGKFEGENAKEAFKKLSQGPLNRNAWLDTLIRRLETADSYTVVVIVEGLFEMKLTKDELERIYPPICKFKEDPDEAHNWLSIRFQMNKIVGDKDFCM